MNDLKSVDGTPYTGAILQWLSDGIIDSHAIYSQLDDVKHQYGCFFDSVVKGKPTIVAPGALGAPCQ